MAIDERLEEIRAKWNFDITLPMAVPWGKDDVVWLVDEIKRLRAENERVIDDVKHLRSLLDEFVRTR